MTDEEIAKLAERLDKARRLKTRIKELEKLVAGYPAYKNIGIEGSNFVYGERAWIVSCYQEPELVRRMRSVVEGLFKDRLVELTKELGDL